MRPFRKMRNQSHLEFVDRREITIVGDEPAGNSPHPLCRVEFRRIGWQSNPLQTVLVLDEKIFQGFCFVPLGVVQNQINLPVSSLEKIIEKVAKGLAVEGGSIFGNKDSRFQVDRSKEANLLSGRGRGDMRLLPPWVPTSASSCCAAGNELRPRTRAGCWGLSSIGSSFFKGFLHLGVGFGSLAARSLETESKSVE